MMRKKQSEDILPPNYMHTVRQRLSTDFKDDNLRKAAESLLRYISQTPPSVYSDLTMGAIRSIIKDSNVIYSKLRDKDFARIVSTLSGGRYRMLDIKFTYIDQYSGTPYLLTKSEMSEILSTGVFYHPEIIDEVVEDIKDHIVVTYKASELGIKVYTERKQKSGR